jgi:hypothetical protein
MITVKWEVNVKSGYEKFSYEDLNTTKEEWLSMDEESQNELVQEALNDMPDRVYPVLDVWM